MSQPAQPVPPASPPVAEPAQPTPGELILSQGKLHWAILVRPVMITCLAIVLFSYGEPLFGAASLVAAGLFWAAALLAAWDSVFVITERRVRIRAGTLYKVSLDLPLDQVDAVAVRQDTMGRLLGYGTLLVDGKDGSRAVCPSLARPDEFRLQLEALRGKA